MKVGKYAPQFFEPYTFSKEMQRIEWLIPSLLPIWINYTEPI